MATTFLKIVASLERDYLISTSKTENEMPDATKTILRRLVQFIKQGTFTDSEVEHFILINFRLSSGEIQKKYNQIHFEKKKSVEAFRAQISNLNSYLVALFKVSANELNDAFTTNKKEVLKKLVDIMDAFEVGDFNLTTRFPFISQGYLPADETSSVYTVEECQAEIQLLKTLDMKNIDEMIREVDIDKLVFVLQTIRQPLVSNTYEKREGKKNSVKTPKINKSKMEFNKAFNLVKPKTLKPVDKIEGKEVEGTRVIYEETEKIKEVPEQIPYNLGITKEMAGVLTKYVSMYKSKSLSDKKKDDAKRESTYESQNECFDLLEMYTPQGFEKALKKLNLWDIHNCIEGFLKK